MDDVERIAQGQVYTGSQAIKLGLADSLGGTIEALVHASELSMAREVRHVAYNDPFEYWISKDAEIREIYDSLINGGPEGLEIVRTLIDESPICRHLPEPDDTQIHDMIKRVQISWRANVVPQVIPQVNMANETFEAVLGHALQSDDERSPIPVDQPPSRETGNGSSTGRLIMGAMLGIALSNNIPLWQLPMFCYWYAAQGAGKVSTGIFDGWLNRLFANFVLDDDLKPRSTFPRAQKGLDIRMELPPIEIFY